MGVVDTIKEWVIPDAESGVELQCTNCGETFDEPLENCPNCGSEETKEVGGFDMRPDE
ncbi:hydrogenase maturation nickel metallochaperone HypA [Halorussus limi]|uniref:Hydrogenase maturation nickel metallochaperone HypA n=1 Tax=Halorussus limi TaxID=2938695 RepID=A0A8U0HTC1_9EURY|nr:hydrogenase maturation nickel metallochaperone HypA [Halorussus limi]UPV74137.1 hydrogenase maturation nickel metallochaperone HypA [Halorussus limi]